MKKLIALVTTSVLFTGLSAGVSARETAEQVVQFNANLDKTPVVHVYELTDEEVLRVLEARAQHKRELGENDGNATEFSIDEVLGLITQ